MFFNYLLVSLSFISIYLFIASLIHLCIFCRLFEIKSQKQQIKEGHPDVHVPSNALQLFLRNPKVFLGLQQVSGSSAGSQAQW